MLHLPWRIACHTRFSHSLWSPPIAVSANIRWRNSSLANFLIFFLSPWETLANPALALDCLWGRWDGDEGKFMPEGPAWGGEGSSQEGEGGSGVDGNTLLCCLRVGSWTAVVAYGIYLLGCSVHLWIIHSPWSCLNACLFPLQLPWTMAVAWGIGGQSLVGPLHLLHVQHAREIFHS